MRVITDLVIRDSWIARVNSDLAVARMIVDPDVARMPADFRILLI